MAGIYWYSHFEINELGHGGSKRSAQITELLNTANIPFIKADLALYQVKSNKLSSYLSGLQYSKKMFHSLKNNYATGRYLQQFGAFIKDKRPDLFILEATTGYNLLLIRLLAQQNIPVIAIPHNLESLVKDTRNTFIGKDAPDWLFDEVEYLKLCKCVFPISKEETWLLSVLGTNARYLPYYPTENVKARLLNIRNTKQAKAVNATGNRNVLLLGTFYNIPTYNGYLELINNIRHLQNINIHIAGYGSEQMYGNNLAGHIKVWGSLEQESLERLFAECDYAIIHQEPTSGSLTRIPELLITGLPILANPAASRSYYGTEGIYVYNDTDELIGLINKELPAPPVPLHPVEEANFIKYIQSVSLNYKS